MQKILLYIILVVTLFVGCVSGNDVSRPTLAVTIEPYRYIVEAVAGEKWEVVSVVPKGNSPETFDPTPGQMMKLGKCEAYFLVGGLGFEESWVEKIKEVYPALPFVDTSSGILRVDDDPHLWTSPDNMVVIARNVCAALCRMDTCDTTGYKARLQAIEKMIAATDTSIRRKLADASSRSFLVFHPSLTYFARLYGINQIVLEEHGKEPSAAHVKHVIDEARSRGVRNVLVQAEFDKNHAAVVARELNATLQTINPLSYDWHGEMLHIADCLNK
ncbi:MAG: zinc ABC transporter substrate-binding protein [Bacteroidaceae bacterium]|nr:zinc ABC transporter substrate-binding protein [Bacteroidaceae bacterium]